MEKKDEMDKMTVEIDVFGQWKGDVTFLRDNKEDLIKQINELIGFRHWRFDIYLLIEELSQHNPIAIAYLDSHIQPLHWVCCSGNLVTLRRWLTSGVSINVMDQLGTTPLMKACLFGHFDQVIELLKWGADIGHINNLGETPLTYACMSNHDTIASLLISSGDTKPTQKEICGRDALYYARKNKMKEIIKLLKQS